MSFLLFGFNIFLQNLCKLIDIFRGLKTLSIVYWIDETTSKSTSNKDIQLI